MKDRAANSMCPLPRLRGRVGDGVSLRRSIGLHELCCIPPPYPSPASGGGNRPSFSLALIPSARERIDITFPPPPARRRGGAGSPRPPPPPPAPALFQAPPARPPSAAPAP